jgi:hypothetical protein
MRAQGIGAESPQESASALSEDLERIARFFTLRDLRRKSRRVKNAPNFINFYS